MLIKVMKHLVVIQSHATTRAFIEHIPPNCSYTVTIMVHFGQIAKVEQNGRSLGMLITPRCACAKQGLSGLSVYFLSVPTQNSKYPSMVTEKLQ